MIKYEEEGSRIGQIRERLGLTQTEFAKKVGANSKGVVSTWEKGKHIPSLNQLQIIANLVNTTVEWILTGQEYPGSVIMQQLAAREKEISKCAGYKQYRIEATVAAGNADYFDRVANNEFKCFDYDPDNYFYVEIDNVNGDSMYPMLKPGDGVLVDGNGTKIKNGDFVLAKWDKKAAIKIYTEDKEDIILSSINYAVLPIRLNKKKVKCYRVKLMEKN